MSGEESNGRKTDLVVIGAGSAGFAAAIRASELGARVVMVQDGVLGGTCVNVGCVPSKTLIRAAQARYAPAHHGFEGVRSQASPTDLPAVIAQKDELVARLRRTKYEDVLAAYPDVELARGRAALSPDGTVDVDGRTYEPSKIVIATGSRPRQPSIPGLAGTPYFDSTGLLSVEELPEHLLVIGGGYAGLELGQVFSRLGSRVSVMARTRLLSSEDQEVSLGLQAALVDEGMRVATDVSIAGVSGSPGHIKVEIEDERGYRVLAGTHLLVATGRRANTDGMGLSEAGVELDSEGSVLVGPGLETSRPGVFAAGDVTGEPAYVYVAAYQGRLAVENALGEGKQVEDLRVVPRVTFTDPAVASVGWTEEQARAKGVDVVVSKLPLSQVPRAIVARDTRGFIKLVADRSNGLLAGAHILAPEAGETIQLAVLAMRFEIPVEAIAETLFPYLTSAEGFKLAALGFSRDVAKLSCCAS